MAFFQGKIHFWCVLILCCMSLLVSSDRRYTSPSVPRLTDVFTRVSIDRGFSKVFGGSNIQIINGSMATLDLDKNSGEVLQNDWYFKNFNSHKCSKNFIKCHRFSFVFDSTRRIWIGIGKQISLWILQCCYQAACWSHFWGCSGFLCKFIGHIS